MCLWGSRKQGTVDISIREGEYCAMSHAAKELVWILLILQDAALKCSIP